MKVFTLCLLLSTPLALASEDLQGALQKITEFDTDKKKLESQSLLCTDPPKTKNPTAKLFRQSSVLQLQLNVDLDQVRSTGSAKGTLQNQNETAIAIQSEKRGATGRGACNPPQQKIIFLGEKKDTVFEGGGENPQDGRSLL